MKRVTVTVAATRGSTPREAGAAMVVSETGITGTIGGGALEWEAMRLARAMLAEGRREDRRTFPLGPDLGQCCGGAVTLDFSEDVPDQATGAQHIWIWGAGHVGRAVAGVLAPMDSMDVTLVDTTADRMPEPIPQGVAPLVATDMPRAVTHAPTDAHHIILSYSHDIDLALCDAALRHGFASCGLIGSDTKWVRFQKRLQQMGHSDAQISRITCPIGDPSLGKHPQAIAIGVAARLIDGRLLKQTAPEEGPKEMFGGT